MRNTLGHAVGEYLLENRRLARRGEPPGVLHLTHIAEEESPQRAIARHRLLHRLEAYENEALKFLLGVGIKRQQVGELLHHLLALLVHESVEDLPLIAEVGVDGATTLARHLGDVVHRGILDALLGEELSRHIQQPFTRIQSHCRP